MMAPSRVDLLPRRRHQRGCRKEARLEIVRPEVYVCNTCGELPGDAFHASVIKHKKHMCKSCIKDRNVRYARERPEVFAAQQARLCAGPGSEGFSARDFAAVVERHNHTCAITGATGVPMTVVAADSERPLSMENAAVVRRRLVPALARMAGEQRARLLQEGAAKGRPAPGAVTMV
jgi:hypothetical protein